MKNEKHKFFGYRFKYLKCNNIFLYNNKHHFAMFQTRADNLNFIWDDNLINNTNNQRDK